MKNPIKISKKDNIIFGAIFFFLFLVIGLYPLLSNNEARIWSIILCLAILLITLIRPNLFRFLNILWIKFGILLGKIISPVIMSIVFFLVVTPVGIFVRLTKKDVMRLKKKDNSYWINRENKIQTMKKQF